MMPRTRRTACSRKPACLATLGLVPLPNDLAHSDVILARSLAAFRRSQDAMTTTLLSDSDASTLALMLAEAVRAEGEVIDTPARTPDGALAKLAAALDRYGAVQGYGRLPELVVSAMRDAIAVGV